MNEYCAVGLHAFGEWLDVPKSDRQARKCRQCTHVEHRHWEPEPTQPYDPYADLTRRF